MGWISAAAGLALVFIILWDAFEAMVLPRRVTQKIRLTRLFYAIAWRPWAALARHVKKPDRRENYLSFFGPLSLLILIGIWATGLLLGFALLHFGIGKLRPDASDFISTLYMSGTTLFTLGIGDVTPESGTSKMLTVLESGTGIAFLALIISYLPVLYGAFSEREINISLLDARAGSPPNGTELLIRAQADDAGLTHFLAEWERWSAQLLESHLSYPVLGYYRSQHSNQSWLAALTTILDTCTMLMTHTKGSSVKQARLTFAMARHALIDLAQIYGTPPRLLEPDRLSEEQFSRTILSLKKAGYKIQATAATRSALDDLRLLYEPYAHSLACLFLIQLPPWEAEKSGHDNWQSHPWKEFLKLTESRKKSQQMQDHF